MRSLNSASDNDKWIFPIEKIKNTPSIKWGMSESEELHQRQNAAALIRNIAAKLKEHSINKPNAANISKPNPPQRIPNTNLCSCTAMVYMHRFYMFHPFQKFPANSMAPCALFLAAKVEEVPIRLEYILKTAHMFIHPSGQPLTEKELTKLKNELIYNENLLLQTLGFNFSIQHPHPTIIHAAKQLNCAKTMTKKAFDVATMCLHFTNMCVKYPPEVIACVCLDWVFRSLSVTYGPSEEGKYWWELFAKDLTGDRLKEIGDEFAAIIKGNKNFKIWWDKMEEKKPRSSQDPTPVKVEPKATRQ